ncbi:MAG: HAD hydrolase-like protein [Microgenomates group bacterium]
MTLEQYLAQHPKKYLIFDLDDTLAHLNINWNTIRQGVFDIVAQQDEQLVADTVNERFATIYLANRAVTKHGEKMKDEITKFWTAYEKNNYSGYIPNSGLITTLKSLDLRYKKYIWTTNTEFPINDFIQKEGLGSQFKKIVSHKTSLYLKPEADGFKDIYVPGTPLSDYLMIGDSINDMGAAKNAGIDFFEIDYFTRQ